MKFIRKSGPDIWEVEIDGKLDYVYGQLCEVWSASKQVKQKALVVGGPFPMNWTEQGMEGNVVKVHGYQVMTEHDGSYKLAKHGIEWVEDM